MHVAIYLNNLKQGDLTLRMLHVNSANCMELLA